MKKAYNKALINHSLRFFIYIILALGLISFLFEDELRLILIKILFGILLFGVVFIINTALLIYYNKTKRKPTEKIGWKVFFTGWPLTALFGICFHFAISYLRSIGLALPAPENDASDVLKTILRILTGSLYLYSFVFLIQDFILNQHRKTKMERELFRLENINAKTTNQLLQQQIQPHFLFNALNVLKSLIRKHPDDAEKYLLRLSGFLRVSVSGNKSGIASVAEELKLCNDYMEMQLIRFGDALIYDILIDKENEIMHRNLPFFSLQPLLENAIKHNTLTLEKPLKIYIESANDYIIVRNNLQMKNTIEFSTGNGLSNLQERYRLLSGDKISITQNDEEFEVRLKLI